jgi:cbb3-type cytochrome oxidase maturation protein
VYFSYFVAYIFVGLVIGLTFFFWAVKNEQFRDQQRARFLPLTPSDDITSAKTGRMGRIEVFGLIFLACSGLAASAAVLIFSLIGW